MAEEKTNKTSTKNDRTTSKTVKFPNDLIEEMTNEYLPKVLNNKNIIKVIVGNKLDREFDRKISCNEVEEMVYKVNIELFEVSVKSGINMNNLFKYVMKELSKN